MQNVTTIPESRTVILRGEINDETAASVCLALLRLDAEGPGKPITMMISSNGGSVAAGMEIIDTMNLIGGVETICTGFCGSMAALILMAGEPGCRSILPHAKVLLHQPLGGASGLVQTSDFEIQAREMSRTKAEVYAHICQCTGKSLAQVTKDCDRDFWLDSAHAKAYGIVDKIESQETRQSIYPAGNV